MSKFKQVFDFYEILEKAHDNPLPMVEYIVAYSSKKQPGVLIQYIIPTERLLVESGLPTNIKTFECWSICGTQTVLCRSEEDRVYLITQYEGTEIDLQTLCFLLKTTKEFRV